MLSVSFAAVFYQTHSLCRSPSFSRLHYRQGQGIQCQTLIVWRKSWENHVKVMRKSKKHCENCKTLTREHHISFQGVTKRPFLISFSSHKLRFVIIQVWSQLKKSFVTLCVLEFCHNLSLVIFWVIQFCHTVSFWVCYIFEFLSLATIWVFEFLSQFEFLSFITIWFF